MALAPIVFIATLLHLYIGWRLGSSLTDLPWALATLIVLLIASAVAMPLGMMTRGMHSKPLADRVAWAGMLFMGFFSSLFVLTIARDVVLLAVAAIGMVASTGTAYAEIAVLSARAVPLIALAITTWGFLNARRTAKVVRVDVPIAGLPAALSGFTIAQISDVHVGPTIKQRYVTAIVERVNALNADMVALTGDLVDGTVPDLSSHVAPLGLLRSRHGSFFVTGNHEYYSGAPAWIREFRRLGMTVLLNEHVVVGHDGAKLIAAGVTDFSAGHFDPSTRSDPAAALAGAPADADMKLLLAHQPRSAAAASDAGFDLQLSGHTHGGQFWPWNLFVPMQQPYTAGLHRLKKLWVYTSRGTGYWGPPKRFGAPSEITLLTLVPV
ncbi:metallophosphoesterase [soil metagenome]